MHLRHFAVLAFALAWPLTQAQPAPAASAAATGPRLLTPAETRDTSSVPGDLRPEDPVVPQLSIPLGKAAAPGPARVRPATNTPAAAGGVDDAVARCEARASKPARAACLRALRQKPAKP